MFTAGVAGEPVTAGAVLWRRGGKVCDGLAPVAAGFRGQAFGGAAGVFFLPGVPSVQDPLVADDQQCRGDRISGARPIRRHQPRVMSLVAGSLVVAKPRSAPVRRAEEAEHRRLHRELEAAGFAVTYELPADAHPLTALRHDGEELTGETHAACPGPGCVLPLLGPGLSTTAPTRPPTAMPSATATPTALRP